MENKYGHFFREGEAVVMTRNGKVVWFVDGFITIAEGKMQYALDLVRIVNDKQIRKTTHYLAVKLYN